MSTKQECSQCELELTDDCPRYGGAASCQEAEMEVCKGMEYDHHTDSCYAIPECPVCGVPFFIEEDDVNSVIECYQCHTRLRIPSVGWVWKYIQDFTGERIEKMPCLTDGCDGTMKVKKIKYNGNWVTAGGKCEKCGTRFIV